MEKKITYGVHLFYFQSLQFVLDLDVLEDERLSDALEVLFVPGRIPCTHRQCSTLNAFNRIILEKKRRVRYTIGICAHIGIGAHWSGISKTQIRLIGEIVDQYRKTRSQHSSNNIQDFL
jgi:hypothetical protein